MKLAGYRKFIVAMTAIVSATGMVAAGYVSDSIYSTVMLASVGIFSLANASQKWRATNDSTKP